MQVYIWITRTRVLKIAAVNQDKLHTIAFKMLVENSSIEKIKLKVCGQSMWPSIQHGDTVIAVRVEPTSLKIGDIVIFQHLYIRIIHRVVRKGTISGKPCMIQTQGDNALYPDPPIPWDQVLCRILIIIPSTPVRKFMYTFFTFASAFFLKGESKGSIYKLLRKDIRV